ncbi:MAG: ABC transporter ATP-binding protein/permease [Anaerolineaceae bacterium]|nr:ABC transporter ATP-binding protein/permease [Anaerolineaceae bacterium]
MTTLKRLVYLLKPYWRVLIIIAILLLAGIALELAPPLLQKSIIDEVIGNRDLSNLGILIGGLVGLYAIQQLTEIGDTYIRHKLGGQFILDMRVRLYAYLQHLSLSFFESTSTGELMSRVTNDVNALENFVTHGATFVVIDFLRLVGAVAILLWLNWKLALLVCIPIPILGVALRMFNTRIRPVYRRMRARLGDINAKLQDNLAGIQTIQAFGQESRELKRFMVESENYYHAVIEGIRYWATFFPVMRFLSLLGNAVVLGAGAVMVIRDALSLGSLVAFISYLNFLYTPIRRLIDIDNILQEAIAAGERIFELFDERPIIHDAPDAIDLPQIEGDVIFDDVHFRYDTGDEVLVKVNFSMPPGTVVALVGPSGAGKTSLASLLCRFYDPIQGKITIDGYDIKQVNLASLRSQVAVVLQDTFLFNTTVRENLLFGKPHATDEELFEAAKAAYAHDFILQLTNGYDTEIGERGVRLSGGQKQRLALARAILADPRILILDEATSSVDAEAEYLIQQALESVLQNRTALVIAHRLSTIQNADKIIALEGGRVVEIGDHRELIDRNGLYSQLYKRQLELSSSLEGSASRDESNPLA